MDLPAIREVLPLALAQALQMLTDWLRPLIFNLFVSHNIKQSVLSMHDAALEEDSVGIAVMSLNLLTFATAFGFNGAVDAYTPVAFGEGNRKELFAILRRQLFLLCGLAVVCWVMLINSESLLLFAGLRADVAQRSSHLLMLLGWAIPGDFVYDALGRWMRGQQMQRRVATCSLFALGVNIGINLCFSSETQPAIVPLVAMIAQNTILPLLLFVAYRSSRPASFGPSHVTNALEAPLSHEAPADAKPLRRQLSTAVTQMVWTCAEMWAWEIQVFEASALGTGNAAAYTLLSSTYSLAICTFPVSIAGAAMTLFGDALGQGDSHRAVRMLTTGCNLTVASVFCYGTLLCLLQAQLAELLGGGVSEVEAAYRRVLPLILAMQLQDGLFNVYKMWLTVRKQQIFGAVMAIFVYYCIGLPCGAWLAFGQGWGLSGLWFGLGLAVLLGSAACGWRVARDVLQLGSYPQIRKRVLFQLLPGVVVFSAISLGQVPWHRPAEQMPSFVALQGTSPCTWSSGEGNYVYPFPVRFDIAEGTYGWQAAIANLSMARPHSPPDRRLQMGHASAGSQYRVGELRMGGRKRDLYDVPYTMLIYPGVEVGWGVWLARPEVRQSGSSPAAWTSRAFVGTRMSSSSHNFCGCQYVSGTATSFRTTEYGRALLPLGHNVPIPVDIPTWYLNLTRQEINQQILEMCEPYSRDPCPDSNETAYAEWMGREASRSQGALQPWVKTYESIPY